ncbi:hypothetical protein [Singulisphaera acidiphila]|uniref:Uncharacterized protein n=1 Tax=Singulisphaera acidiphila (strain ATCC BAA-1392 / DSM 18658 / VKM B-2454 / MOB10) TaxID=886293 RepID=L0DNH9_SINAD|nr:hypothetical protein [Singulisphaera acidiphila]AGA30370.1 hypothetical protein Sinac_6283 [Singulisphaera acidiphila DSM 18658]
MSQANVRSTDAIKQFKLALLTYAEDSRVALGAMEMEIRQVRNWLERDQYTYWTSQVKRAKEKIAEARTELNRRRLSQSNSDAVSDSDQKEALRIAKHRLEEAEDKVERIKKWGPVLEHALSEYHSQSQPLSDKLSGGLVGSLALLERMIVALEEYAALQAPAAPTLPPTSSLDTVVPPSGAREPGPGVSTHGEDRPPLEQAVEGTESAEVITQPRAEPSGEETSRPTS